MTLSPPNLPQVYEFQPILDRCRWLRKYQRTKHTATTKEWHTTLRLLRHVKDDMRSGEDLAHEWAIDNPAAESEPPIAELFEKIKEWQPTPTSCADFRAIQPQWCTGCRYAQWVTSPIFLENIQMPAKESPQFAEEVIREDGYIETITVNVPNPPYPYYRSEKGGIFMYGSDNTESTRIFEYDIYPVRRLKEEETGNETIEISLTLPLDGTQLIRMPNSFLHDQRKLLTTLSDKGAIVRPTELQKLQTYLIEYAKLIQKNEPAHEEFVRFGWRDLDTKNARFVLGDFVLSQNGELRRSTPAPALQQFRSIISAKGNLQQWRSAFDVYKRVPCEAFRFTQLLGFAAPLFAFTPFHGLIYNMVGESGSGKSTALRMMSSIWGKPSERHIRVQDNTIPIQNIIGALQNIPITWDELTTIDSEALVDMAYAITEGRGKHRANETGRTVTNTVQWKTLVCGASNLSLYEKLGMAKSGNNAHAYRIFEVPVTSSSVSNRDEIDWAMTLIDHHHGLAGRIYAAYLIKNIPQINNFIIAMSKHYMNQYHMVTAERYWYTLIACVAVGGSIAKKLELHDFDVDASIDWSASQLTSLRKIVKSVEGDALSLISQFFQTHIHQTLHVHANETFFSDSNELNVRIEYFNGKPLRAYISQHAIKDFCTTQKVEYSWLSRRLKECRVLTDAKASKSLGKDTPIMTGIVNAWELDLTRLPMEETVLRQASMH